MDLYCQRCGEPYEFVYVNDDMPAEERARFFKGEGCPACFGKPVEERPFRAQLAAAMADVLGDDTDGIAAMMDDAEYLMGQSFWE